MENKDEISKLEEKERNLLTELEKIKTEIKVIKYHALENYTVKRMHIRQLIHPFIKTTMGYKSSLRYRESNEQIRRSKFAEFDKEYNFGFTFNEVFPEYNE
jgi:hypothetical protein